MGRPVHKMNKEALKFLLENSGKMSFANMARQLGMHHTTVLHWVKKLSERGMVIVPNKSQSDADRMITELKNELGM